MVLVFMTERILAGLKQPFKLLEVNVRCDGFIMIKTSKEQGLIG